jgi:putative copper export protein
VEAHQGQRKPPTGVVDLGLVMLLIAMPVAGRAASARERTPLLAGVVGRFSRMASIVVAVLVMSGIVQAVALVGSVPALYETAYGRLVLVKVGLLLALLSLGAYNQRESSLRLGTSESRFLRGIRCVYGSTWAR